jgi:teichuronic acid biosynthesis glycosyltransferase TuaH
MTLSGKGLVVCSLEPWDEVWRRNQFLVAHLLRHMPSLQVLYVEPPYDLAHGVARRQHPPPWGPRRIPGAEQLWRVRPVKPLPRLMGPWSDMALRGQVRRAARGLGLVNPSLWINDLTYAPLVEATGWPTVYDITDDWLVEAGVPERVRRRRRELEQRLLRDADEVVVCSPSLAESRGRVRAVTLIPNGVDLDHFTRSQPRPTDLGRSPVAVYVGTLQEERFDVELVVELATRLRRLTVSLVGPDALRAESRAALTALPNVQLLGPRPYAEVPAYLQHADVIIVPHKVNAFTEALDPIKAYECLAVGRPTVATPVAGFRALPRPVAVATRESFVDTVNAELASPSAVRGALPTNATWHARGLAFEQVLHRSRAPRNRSGPEGDVA